MLQKIVQLPITEATFNRLLSLRKGFESADDILNQRLDLADVADPTTAPAAPAPKPAKEADLDAAIVSVLQAHGGEASNQVVITEVAHLLPDGAKHPNFAMHVSWTASGMRKDGRLQNGKDHGQYGVWKLVPQN